MKNRCKTVMASALLAAFTSSAALAHDDTPFSKADDCMVSELMQIYRDHAGTAATVDVYLDPIQEKCESETGEKIQHEILLKKGPSNFRANGTQFIFK